MMSLDSPLQCEGPDIEQVLSIKDLGLAFQDGGKFDEHFLLKVKEVVRKETKRNITDKQFFNKVSKSN